MTRLADHTSDGEKQKPALGLFTFVIVSDFLGWKQWIKEEDKEKSLRAELRYG